MKTYYVAINLETDGDYRLDNFEELGFIQGNESYTCIKSFDNSFDAARWIHQVQENIDADRDLKSKFDAILKYFQGVLNKKDIDEFCCTKSISGNYSGTSLTLFFK